MSDNTGHGHVYPRPDGVRMRCGGPAMCNTCALDLARKTREEQGVTTAEAGYETPLTQIADLRAQLAAKTAEVEKANATVAAAVSLLRTWVEEFGGIHTENCPQDDTCNCVGRGFNDGANGVIRTLPAASARLIEVEKAAPLIAGSLAAVMPLLRTIQEHCGPGDHHEIIARAAENLKAWRALSPTPDANSTDKDAR
jgi:hypothetical protein